MIVSIFVAQEALAAAVGPHLPPGSSPTDHAARMRAVSAEVPLASMQLPRRPPDLRIVRISPHGPVDFRSLQGRLGRGNLTGTLLGSSPRLAG